MTARDQIESEFGPQPLGLGVARFARQRLGVAASGIEVGLEDRGGDAERVAGPGGGGAVLGRVRAKSVVEVEQMDL